MTNDGEHGTTITTKEDSSSSKTEDPPVVSSIAATPPTTTSASIFPTKSSSSSSAAANNHNHNHTRNHHNNTTASDDAGPRRGTSRPLSLRMLRLDDSMDTMDDPKDDDDDDDGSRSTTSTTPRNPRRGRSKNLHQTSRTHYVVGGGTSAWARSGSRGLSPSPTWSTRNSSSSNHSANSSSRSQEGGGIRPRSTPHRGTPPSSSKPASTPTVRASTAPGRSPTHRTHHGTTNPVSATTGTQQAFGAVKTTTDAKTSPGHAVSSTVVSTATSPPPKHAIRTSATTTKKATTKPRGLTQRTSVPMNAATATTKSKPHASAAAESAACSTTRTAAETKKRMGPRMTAKTNKQSPTSASTTAKTTKSSAPGTKHNGVTTAATIVKEQPPRLDTVVVHRVSPLPSPASSPARQAIHAAQQKDALRHSVADRSWQLRDDVLRVTTTTTTTTRSPTRQSSKAGSTMATKPRSGHRPGVRRTDVTEPKAPPSSCCCFLGEECRCGTYDCECSEELCQCKAYQLVHSLGSRGRAATVASNCCQGLSKRSRDQPASTSADDDTDGLEGRRPYITVDPLAAPVPHSASHSPAMSGRAEFLVSGMTCSMCSQAVDQAVQNLGHSIVQVEISLTTDTVLIGWHVEDTTTTPVMVERIRNAIEAVGYTVEDARLLPSNTNRDMGVLETGTTETQAFGDDDDDADAVEQRWARYRERQQTKVAQKRAAFLWALMGAIPILVLTMIVPHIVPNAFHNRRVHAWHTTFELEGLVLWLLASPVQFICGWEFYKMAWYGFYSGTAGMDMLVALGTTASYGYAFYGVWNNDDHAAHFFETSTVLIAFVLAGKWMQAAAVRRTSEALTQLMKLQSPTAVRITPAAQGTTASSSNVGTFNPLLEPYNEEIVETKYIAVGDMVKIIRGASIPADGLIVYGEISVDESMVTGESLPGLKTPSSVVLGGTVCVESGINGGKATGAAFVKVTGVGSSTALAQIVQLVQEAQTQAVPIQSFADRVSAVFVPTVCTLSLITYLAWYALCSSNVVPESWYRDEWGEDATTFSLMFAIACLVISCPCALGLATPTAVMVGTGVAARNGVLMKGGEALEIASKVDTVVFDKTGTLTRGAPAVTDFVRIAKNDRDDAKPKQEITDDLLLWMIGSLERNSEHPLARAIVSYAETQLGDVLHANPFVEPSIFRGVTGRGASGKIAADSCTIAVGNRSFAILLGLSVSSNVDFEMRKLEEQGKTSILVAVGDDILAVLGIADELKADARLAVKYLQDSMGIDVWMVTGDNARTAAAIGHSVQLTGDRIISEAMPATKLEKIKELQANGKLVVMVGDGVNDSPALAQADVGIGIGTGASIATEASDMVLVKGHVSDVCTALHLSRTIFRRIQWNLVLSLVYNCLGIPLAAGVFYPLFHVRLPPTLAAVAMALSSLSVVISSLTLRFYRPPCLSSEINDRNFSRTVSRSTTRMQRQPQNDESLLVGLLSSDHLETNENAYNNGQV